MKLEKSVTLCCPQELAFLFKDCKVLSDYVKVVESLDEEYVYCLRFNDKLGSTKRLEDTLSEVPKGSDPVEYCKLNYPLPKQEVFLFVFRKDEYFMDRSIEIEEVVGIYPNMCTNGWTARKPLTIEENKILLDTYCDICNKSAQDFIDDMKNTFKIEDKAEIDENGKLLNREELDKDDIQRFKEKWEALYPDWVKQCMDKL